MFKKIFVVIVVVAVFAAGFFFLSNHQMVGHVIKSLIGSSEETVLIKTSKGDIKIELYPREAPVTVENFLSYVEDGSYEGTVFHRVIKDFMIQGGGFIEQGVEKQTREPIRLESNNGLKNEFGTIAMARTMIPDSATNQFFINTKDNDFLNYAPENPGYAVFGKVVKGMDVVTEIENSKTSVKYGMQDWPIEEVVIEEIVVL